MYINSNYLASKKQRFHSALWKTRESVSVTSKEKVSAVFVCETASFGFSQCLKGKKTDKFADNSILTFSFIFPRKFDRRLEKKPRGKKKGSIFRNRIFSL